MTYDCQTCGACCCNPDENRAEGFVDYVEVRRREPLARDRALARRLTVINSAGQRHMKLKGDRCAALTGTLGRSVSCTIYELRPQGCRRVEAGGRRCLQYRKERGIG